MKQYIIPIGAAVLFAACSPAPPDVDLLQAASKGNLDAIKKHIAAGTDLNQKDPNPTGNKDDALGMAAAFGHTDVAKAYGIITNGGYQVNPTLIYKTKNFSEKQQILNNEVSKKIINSVKDKTGATLRS